MKKIIFALLLVSLPVLADEINMTPQNTFSGYTNNGIRPQYPRLNRTYSSVQTDEQRLEIMRAKSVRHMGDVNISNAPMTYSQFPQNYDSSNTLRTQEVRNNMQNLIFAH